MRFATSAANSARRTARADKKDDVEADLRQFRNSPLARLIAATEIDPAEQEQLLDAPRQANQQIAAAPTTGAIANAVDASFKSVTGPAFSMDVALDLAES